MIYAIFYMNFDEYRSVCMNFVRLDQMWVEMYVGRALRQTSRLEERMAVLKPTYPFTLAVFDQGARVSLHLAGAAAGLPHLQWPLGHEGAFDLGPLLAGGTRSRCC